MTVTHPPTNIAGCPATFDAEPVTKVSQSAHDVPTVDAAGHHPTMADELNAQGVTLTRDAWEQFAALPNPAWTPTYERVVLDEPVEHQVCVCPNCGSPIKVG